MKHPTLLLLALAVALSLCQAQTPSWTISVSPTAAVAGSSSASITVTGTYVSSATVRWNTTTLICVYHPSSVGPGYLTCTIPGSLLTSAGSASIQASAYVSPSTRYSNIVTFTIFARLTITTACPMPNGTVGQYYSRTLAASGGLTPYAWWIVAGSGTLPPGLALISGGRISGTPTASGDYKFTIGVGDEFGQSVTRPCAISVGGTPLTITTACPMANGAVGTYYSQALSASGGTAPYAWGLVAGAGTLPPGLTLSGSTISGTPTATGTYPFTLRVMDYMETTATKACSITVNPGLTITTSCPLSNASLGVAYSHTFTATGGMTPYNWSIVDSSPPPGLSLTSYSGVLSGTPTSAGPFNFIVRVADYMQQSTTKACSLTVVSALSISLISPSGTSAGCGGLMLTIVGTGFVPATISAGSVVEWSSQATGTQTLSPSSATSTQLVVAIPGSLLAYPGVATIRVRNPGSVYSNAVNFTIEPPPVITLLDPASTSAGAAGLTLTVAGSGFLPGSAEGGSQVQFTAPSGSAANLPTTYIDSTELQAEVPAGLLTVAGTARVAVVSPPCGVRSNLFPFEIFERLQLVTTALPDGAVGVPYSATLQASGGRTPYFFSVTGTLPPGLRFVSETGVISGTPTAPGTYPITAGVRDSAQPQGSAIRELSITIVSGLTITTTSPLPSGTVGTAYSARLAATGGQPSYGWALTGGALPAGLSLNSATGEIAGTPTSAGTSEFSVTVTDTARTTASRSFSLTIVAGLAIITASPLPEGTVSLAYSQSLAATGGATPYTWSATGMPPWLSLNPASGALSGTPTGPGTFGFTVTVTDSARRTALRDFRLTVNPRVTELTITTAAQLPSATPGTAYGQTLAASGGTPPYTWSATGLPGWLSLNASTGLLSGIPSDPATHRFTVRVTDSAQGSATREFTLSVTPILGALTIITRSPLTAGMVGVAYSQTVQAIGGSGPYRWSITVGVLPQGLSLNATSGLISGTPAAAGTANFRVQVTDNNQRTDTRDFALSIVAAPAAQYAGLTATVPPAQQPRVQLNLAAAVAARIDGTLTLGFAADAVNPIDNPEVAFAAGGRRVNFTIPAGQTRAQFGTAQEMGIQVGTVAGTITVTAPPLSGSYQTRIARLAPTISSVTATRSGSTLTVTIIGYATPRSVTRASFTFSAPSADLQTPALTVNVDSAFTTFYRGASSNPFGSQFRYVQPFTVSGDANMVTSVSVTLTNDNGTSPAATANF